MTAAATDRGYGPWTYERLSSVTDVDNVQREIIGGWLYVWGQRTDDPQAPVLAAESPRYPHANAVAELFLAARMATATTDEVALTAPMDVQFGDLVVQPDVLVLPREPEHGVHPIEVVPLLVVEVSSPSTRSHDLVRKRRAYEQAGVPEYWFVDLDADRIEAYDLADGATAYDTPRLVSRDESLTSTTIPTLTIEIAMVLGAPPL